MRCQLCRQGALLWVTVSSAFLQRTPAADSSKHFIHASKALTGANFRQAQVTKGLKNGTGISRLADGRAIIGRKR